MKQPRRHTTLLFITLGIIAVVLLLIDMATGDTYIPSQSIGRTDRRRMRRDDTQHPSLHPLYPGSSSRVDRYRLVGQRPANADRFPKSAGRPYLLGVSSGAGLGVALFILGAPLLGWADFPLTAIRRHRRFGLDRDRRHLAGA